jgi:hypothetical protein
VGHRQILWSFSDSASDSSSFVRVKKRSFVTKCNKQRGTTKSCFFATLTTEYSSAPTSLMRAEGSNGVAYHF